MWKIVSLTVLIGACITSCSVRAVFGESEDDVLWIAQMTKARHCAALLHFATNRVEPHTRAARTWIGVLQTREIASVFSSQEAFDAGSLERTWSIQLPVLLDEYAPQATQLPSCQTASPERSETCFAYERHAHEVQARMLEEERLKPLQCVSLFRATQPHTWYLLEHYVWHMLGILFVRCNGETGHATTSAYLTPSSILRTDTYPSWEDDPQAYAVAHKKRMDQASDRFARWCERTTILESRERLYGVCEKLIHTLSSVSELPDITEAGWRDFFTVIDQAHARYARKADEHCFWTSLWHDKAEEETDDAIKHNFTPWWEYYLISSASVAQHLVHYACTVLAEQQAPKGTPRTDWFLVTGLSCNARAIAHCVLPHLIWCCQQRGIPVLDTLIKQAHESLGTLNVVRNERLLKLIYTCAHHIPYPLYIHDHSYLQRPQFRESGQKTTTHPLILSIKGRNALVGYLRRVLTHTYEEYKRDFLYELSAMRTRASRLCDVEIYCAKR